MSRIRATRNGYVDRQMFGEDLPISDKVARERLDKQRGRSDGIVGDVGDAAINGVKSYLEGRRARKADAENDKG